MLAKHVHMLAMILVVVGGLAWGVYGATGVQLVRAAFPRSVANGVYMAVGLAALYLAVQRDVYLPFLGETVLPCSLLEERGVQGADTEVPLGGLPAGAKILFWASESAAGPTLTPDWRKAYGAFENAGVTHADAQGFATLRVRRPQAYSVPSGKRLDSHVHWRVCGVNGFIGPVQTTWVSHGPI
jgi:uncharacterized membrane protein YuzA (DUF378 family)